MQGGEQGVDVLSLMITSNGLELISTQSNFKRSWYSSLDVFENSTESFPSILF
jgi:hypothetical protein